MNVSQHSHFIYRRRVTISRVLLSFSSACCGVELSEIQNMQNKHLDAEGDNRPQLSQSALLPFSS